ncbi:hypothetical protein Tco_0568195 [Tanacetum coccineum]
MAYKLELPEELSNIHNTFHVSNLKKCLSDESLVIPMKELRLDDKLNFVEEPVEIMDQEVKQLKQSRIPIVKRATFLILGLSLELILDLVLCWLWRGKGTKKVRPSRSRGALDPSWVIQTLQPGGWVVADGIILLDLSFNALARVVLGRGSSYFIISSLQLDLRSWKLE